MTKPLILITNDDGIQSPGIKHLWDAVREFANIAIIAPHSEKSGSSLATTCSNSLTAREVSWEDGTPAWSIQDGTPADCVKMALNILLPHPPQLILSGVNSGSNAGRTILYSGTVGGVIEGAMRGVPGIAFSFTDFVFPTLGIVKPFISSIVKHFLNSPLPAGSFVNATFPKLEKGIQGVRMARQGHSCWLGIPQKRTHPSGGIHYHLGSQWSSHDEPLDSDIALLQQGYLTVVPLHIGDLTDHVLLKQHQTAMDKLQIESNFSFQKK